jgi:sugar phosphate isomerase/epimerase
MKKTNSRMTQINLEFGNLNIATPDPVVRLETIDLTKRWIDHAVALDCPRVMVNQGGTLEPAVRQSAIETVKTMNAYGKTKHVFLTMEPALAPWQVLVEVIKASGIWANPDCGNFPDKESRDAALPILYRMTAGSSHFKHLPEKYDTVESIKISKEAGYKGIFSIEDFSRNSADPYAPVQTIRDILLANL